jgi:CBS domain-containing protein
MKVEDIMSGDIEVCTQETELQYVARKMAERDVGAIPIVESTESMKPVGIITDRDIVIRAIARGQNPLERKAGDCMSSSLCFVRPDTDLEQCLELMEEHQIRRMLVVDDNGRVCGIVAQADIAQHANQSDTAELVRDVSEPGTDIGQQARYH